MTLVMVLAAVVPVAWLSVVFLWPPFPRAFGREAMVPGVLGVAWCAGVLGVWRWLPGWLPLPAMVGFGLACFISRGRFRAWLAPGPLPPGSMAFASGVRGLASRTWYLERFGVHGPVFKSTQFGRPILCVLGMERICRLMRGHAADLGPSPLGFTESLMGNFLRYMDDARHAEYGGLFRRALAGDMGAEVELELRARARAMLEGLAGRESVGMGGLFIGHARASLDLVLFGLQGGDDRSHAFGALAERLARANVAHALSREDLRIVEEMERLILEHLEDGGACAMGFRPVTARLRTLDPGKPDRVCLDNLVFMHRIATSNVSALMRWLAYYWGQQREIVGRIRGMRGEDRLAALDAFLSETLRLSQSEFLYRRVLRRFEFDGFVFPRGWMVRCCIWESHRTTGALPDAEAFQLRLGPTDYARGHYSPFGMGRHACNGAEITRMLCLALLQELADGFDVRMEGIEPFHRPMRHWGHWQVNRAGRMRVEPTC